MTGTSRTLRCVAIASVFGMISGCAVGPDFVRPEKPAVDRFTAGALPAQTASADTQGGVAQRLIAGRDLPQEWWKLFHSPALNALIAHALTNSPDLQSAEAALRVAQENVRAQQGAYFPTLGGNFSAARYHDASEVSPTLATFVPYFNLYTAQVSADWAPDIWGANRRAVETLKANAEAQKFQLEAAVLTLTCALAGAAIQEASLRAQEGAAQQIVADEEQSLAILKRQLALGQVSGADEAGQEESSAQAEQNLIVLQKQLAQQRDLITVLAGQLPANQIPQTFELDSLELPRDLPVSVPSNLVDRRPDVRMAEADLHAASAQIGVATAAMLPNITLSANGGTTATQLAGLFVPGNNFWTLSGTVSQQIFDGGTLLHKLRGARAAYEQAQGQYRSTVLASFQNVADALEAIKSDADFLKAAAVANDAAVRSLERLRLRHKLGEDGLLTTLQADVAAEQAASALAQARASRFADTVALFQALGGGWRSADDILASVQNGEPQ
ncbi:MAG TPA: efflux transporter outer membrane subunit [Rhizomicrobium sp.]